MTQEAADTLYEYYIKKVLKQVDYYKQAEKDRLLDPECEGICFALDFVDMECELLSDILRGRWDDALDKVAEWERDGGLRDNYVEVFGQIVEDSQDPDCPANLKFKVQGDRRDDWEVRSDIPDQAYRSMYESLSNTNKLFNCLRCLCLIAFAKAGGGDDFEVNDGDIIQYETGGWIIKWEVDYDKLGSFNWAEL